MRDHYKKIFSDKQKLYVMANLRINGWAFSSLAILYGIDTSSVRHQCAKYNIVPDDEVYMIERLVSDIFKQTQKAEPEYEEEYGHKYSKGRTYAEYLKEMSCPPNKKL